MSIIPASSIPICNVCGKSFRNGQGLDYHKQHSVCQKYLCSFCGHRFKSSLGLKYHTEHRICLPAKKIEVKITAKSPYYSYIIPKEELKLTDVMRTVSGNFGETLFGGGNIILKLVELALANPKLDQYWSYYISNRRQPYVLAYDGTCWKLQPQTAEFDAIGEWALDKIKKYLQDNKATAKKQYWTQYFLTKDQHDRKNHSIHKEIRQGMYCRFVNLKALITDKARVTGINIKP